MNCIVRDKAGRSIPAPGRGALTIARQVPTSTSSVLLNVKHRSRQLTFRRTQISAWMDHERTLIKEELGILGNSQLDVAARLVAIEQEALAQEKQAIAMYGMLEGVSNPTIAPLRRALAIWGLTADDIGVVSIHGTSTVANVSKLSRNSVGTNNFPGTQ
jgi:fatty acid synthase subunit alpha, fungi type